MATLAELRLDTRFLTNTTSSDYGNTDLDRNLNSHYDSTITHIWHVQAGWKFDDSNNTDTLPTAWVDLQDGVDNYLLPSEARKIEQVYVMNKDGLYVLLKREQDSDIDLGRTETGMPRTFRLRGRSVILYPTPAEDSVTLDSGLMVMLNRTVSLLTEDTDTPGFEREYHRILVLGAAIDWCISTDQPRKKKELEVEKQKLLIKLEDFYASRDNTTSTGFRPKKENYES